MSGLLQIRREDLEWREVEGEVVILDLRSSKYLSLNKTGAVIWRELASGEATEEGLIAALQRSSEIDEERARKDVKGLIIELRAADLLKA